ncbi:MAG: DUF6788 family protein [Pseudonocardiaceae bacterium]
MPETKGIRLTAGQQAKQRRITKALSEVGLSLHGSVAVRRTRCGNKTCACQSEPERLHGPYIVWTRKLNGRTVTRVLSDEQLGDYQPLIDNSRRITALVAELHELTLEIVETDARRRGRPGRSAKASR